MTNLSSLNLLPLNCKAANILKQTGWTLDRKTQLAAAQLMLWALGENLLEQPQAWVEVTNFSDRHLDWEDLIRNLEKTNPRLLVQYLTETDCGDSYEIDLDGLEPGEAAATLLEELILAVSAQPELLQAD